MGTGGLSVFTLELVGYSTNQAGFAFINETTGASLSTTEANVKIPVHAKILIKRMFIRPVANTKDGATVVDFRINGGPTASQSIAAGSTTDVDSGVLEQVVNPGDKVNFKVDTSASTTGSITLRVIVEGQPDWQ